MLEFTSFRTTSNSIYERFHRIIQDERYNISSLKDLQVDVDLWLRSYNQTRPHSANTSTPIQTFFDSKHICFSEKHW